MQLVSQLSVGADVQPSWSFRRFLIKAVLQQPHSH